MIMQGQGVWHQVDNGSLYCRAILKKYRSFFAVHRPVRSLLPKNMGTFCCFCLSSFKMLPFPSFLKTGIGYCESCFAQAMLVGN